MELTGSTDIRAPRPRVWAALNDPAVLARAIEGVERLEPAGENRYEGALNAKVGPVKARFTGTIELTEIDPPARYVLVGEGKGGVAGFARGSAEVVLDALPDGGTRLSYVARPVVGGRLAQLGARLIEGAAKGYADGFFEKLKAEVEAPAEAAAAVLPAEPAAAVLPAEAGEPVAAPAAAPTPGGLPPWLWLGALVLLALAVLAALLGSR